MLVCARITAVWLKTIVFQLFFQVTGKMAVLARKAVVSKPYPWAKASKSCLYALLSLILSP